MTFHKMQTENTYFTINNGIYHTTNKRKTLSRLFPRKRTSIAVLRFQSSGKKRLPKSARPPAAFSFRAARKHSASGKMDGERTKNIKFLGKCIMRRTNFPIVEKKGYVSRETKAIRSPAVFRKRGVIFSTRGARERSLRPQSGRSPRTFSFRPQAASV